MGSIILILDEVVIVFLVVFFYRFEKYDRFEDFFIVYEDIEFGDCFRVGW